MNKTELAITCLFHNLTGLGNRTMWKIKDEFGSFQNCFEADRSALHRSSLQSSLIERIIVARKNIDPLSVLEEIYRDDVMVSCVDDDDYPWLLRSIFDPPYIFYYRGDLGVLNEFCLAVVGSRMATNYGKVQARRFGNELSRQGIVVVSGLARGIDTEAHKGALEAGGRTAAVLGSGLDIIYPPENVKLYNEIKESGIVLSEFPLHTHPEPGNFPVRNRIISGLCRGVMVVEAQKKSGALITADCALEQGRDVFAIPGPISSKNSAGTNYLIKQGACLVSGIEDILNEYGMNEKDTLPTHWQGELTFGLDEDELSVLANLDYEAVHFDVLMNRTASRLNMGLLNTILLKMELKGIIKAMPGNYYVKL